MAVFTFFKYNDAWRYRLQGEAEAKTVDTFALEEVLGVVGGPLVSVYRPMFNNGLHIRIDIENGFIASVKNGVLDELLCNRGPNIQRFDVYPMC